METYNLTIDASGLACPLPLLRAQKALSTLSSGQKMLIISTDPTSLKDFDAFARQSGHTLLLSQVLGKSYHLVLQKG